MSRAELPDDHRRWYQGLTGYHFLVLAVASMGWMFDTMDQWLYVLARQPAITELLGSASTAELVKAKSGMVQMWFLLGWATGGFVFGMIGDRLGRTRTMAITVLMYAGFTGASALAPNVGMFAVFRFLTGLGIGGEFAAGAALIAESFPAHARPTALGIMQAMSAVGNIMAGLISLFVLPAFGWRYVFAIGVIPALLVFVIRLYVREPDIWHQAQEDARTGKIRLGSITQLFTIPVLRRNTIVGVLLAAVGVIGFWGIGTFSPDLLRGVINPDGLPELKAKADWMASIAIIFQNAGAFFGILTWAWLAQRIGRRWSFAVSFIACAVVVPATFFLTKSFVLALVFFPLMGFALTALFGGYAVYFPELFPTRLRATGTGFCYNSARYISAFSPAAFGLLSGAYGIQMAAAIVSCVFVLALLVLPFAPETRGKAENEWDHV